MAADHRGPHRSRARLLLVDDHAAIRRGMGEVLALEPDLDLEWEAEDIPSALAILERHDPDLVLVDPSLNRGKGLRLIEEIKLRRPEIRVLVLSMHDEPGYAELARRAGAEGLIGKFTATERIVQAIRETLEG